MKFLAVLGVSLALASASHATTYVIDAKANSSGGGTGVPTINLSAGEAFTVSVAATDLWNAGALPRWSNADGLIKTLFATGSDDSGEAAGTQIGAVFPLLTEHGFTAPYGALVGLVGSDYLLIGTSFSGVAPTAGTLNLFYWDENTFDNTQFVTADVNGGVPEPATWTLMLLGVAGLGAALRRGRMEILPHPA